LREWRGDFHDDFARCLTEVWQVARRLLAEKQLAHGPSFFESLTATAFLTLRAWE